MKDSYYTTDFSLSVYPSLPPLQASVLADKALDDLSQANEELRVDIDKWKEAKDKEVSSLMRKVSDDHINFHQKVSSECFKKIIQ